MCIVSLSLPLSLVNERRQFCETPTNLVFFFEKPCFFARKFLINCKIVVVPLFVCAPKGIGVG